MGKKKKRKKFPPAFPGTLQKIANYPCQYVYRNIWAGAAASSGFNLYVYSRFCLIQKGYELRIYWCNNVSYPKHISDFKAVTL